MSDETDALIDGLLERERSSGASIIWAGQKLPCSGGPTKMGKKLEIGGFSPNADVLIVLRTAEVPDGIGLPTIRQSLSFSPSPKGTQQPLRIDSTNTFGDEILVLECNHPSQGA